MTMSNQQNDPDGVRPEDETDTGGPGAEIGRSDGEGSTFEPEEDPEGHAS
jgi:hypothetical protein